MVVRIKNLDLDILNVRWILDIQEGVSIVESEGQVKYIHVRLFSLQRVLKARGLDKFIKNA